MNLLLKCPTCQGENVSPEEHRFFCHDCATYFEEAVIAVPEELIPEMPPETGDFSSALPPPGPRKPRPKKRKT